MNELIQRYTKIIIFFSIFLATAVFTLNNHIENLTQQKINSNLNEKIAQIQEEHIAQNQPQENTIQKELLEKHLEAIQQQETKQEVEIQTIQENNINYFDEGVNSFNSNLFDDAINNFQKALIDGNENEKFESYKYIAQSYENKGNYTLAIDNYNAAITNTNDTYELKNIYAKIANNYINLSDNNKALFYLEKIFRLTYQKNDFLNALNFAKSMNDKSSVERIIDEYLEKNPQEGYELTEYFNWLKE